MQGRMLSKLDPQIKQFLLVSNSVLANILETTLY